MEMCRRSRQTDWNSRHFDERLKARGCGQLTLYQETRDPQLNSIFCSPLLLASCAEVEADRRMVRKFGNKNKTRARTLEL